mmetsp:Transcript_79119/g.118965  ORF Transcript_79119/g.118965 Transcript_79119/m.118965 type:complete len:140 (-) Transcript_79119:6-425(-)
MVHGSLSTKASTQLIDNGARSVVQQNESFDSQQQPGLREEEQMGKRSVHADVNKSDTAQTSAGEPMRKRQASESTGREASKSADCSRNEKISSSDVRETQLPDPTAKVSPDEYLLQLLKAMHGVSMEVKPALSLESVLR